MDSNTPHLYSSEGATNNPRPRFPGQLNPRRGRVQNRLPASLPLPFQGSDPELYQEPETVSSNFNAPVGMKTFNAHDYHIVAPGQSLVHGSNNLDFGCHSSSPNYVNNAPIPQEVELEPFGSQWIPDPQSGMPPEPTTTPLNAPGFNPNYPGTIFPPHNSLDGTTMVQSYTIPFNPPCYNQDYPLANFPSQCYLDGTTLAQSSTRLWYPGQPSQQGSETVFGNYDDGQAVDYPYNASDPIYLGPTLQQARQQLEFFSQPLSTGGNMSEVIAPVPPTTLPGSASYSENTQNTVSRSRERQTAPSPSVRHDAKELELGSTCVRCKVMRKGCNSRRQICEKCTKIPDCCVRLEDLFPPFISPDLYTELDTNQGRRLESFASPSKRRKAQIFLSSEADQRITFLECEVYVYNLGIADPSYEKLQKLALWEDMRSSSMTTQFGWGQIVSCRIPKGSLPPEQLIQQWVYELAQSNPSGVIGNFHGALYHYAMLYTEELFRPLYQLVTLAIVYTSIYNACHSKLSMTLENDSRAAFRVCPRLRAQLLFPLFDKIGKELFIELKETTNNPGGPTTDQHLPLCLVMWFLMLVYQHCRAQTEQASLYLLDPESRIDNLDLKDRAERLQVSINKIRALHKALFKRKSKAASPIFDMDLTIFCRVCAECDLDLCLHNVELKKAHLALRNAIRQHRAEKQLDLCVMENVQSQKKAAEAIDVMDDLVGRLSKNFKGIRLSQLETELKGPPPSEKTASEAKQIDEDAMSVDKNPSIDSNGSLSPDVGCFQKKSREEASESASRKRPLNVMELEGMGGWEYGS